MHTIFMSAFIAALVGLSPEAGAQPSNQAGASESRDVAAAVRVSEVAEIYIVRRDVSTGTNMRAYNTRTLGCMYLVRQRSRDYFDLAQTLQAAAIRVEPGREEDDGYDVRVAIHVGDRRGTILEAYADDRPGPDGMVPGFIDRRRVRISMSFVTALQRFAAEHPNLMRMDQSRLHLCAPSTRP